MNVSTRPIGVGAQRPAREATQCVIGEGVGVLGTRERAWSNGCATRWSAYCSCPRHTVQVIVAELLHIRALGQRGCDTSDVAGIVISERFLKERRLITAAGHLGIRQTLQEIIGLGQRIGAPIEARAAPVTSGTAGAGVTEITEQGRLCASLLQSQPGEPSLSRKTARDHIPVRIDP